MGPIVVASEIGICQVKFLSRTGDYGLVTKFFRNQNTQRTSRYREGELNKNNNVGQPRPESTILLPYPTSYKSHTFYIASQISFTQGTSSVTLNSPCRLCSLLLQCCHHFLYPFARMWQKHSSTTLSRVLASLVAETCLAIPGSVLK